MKFKIDFSKYDYETINKGAYPKFIFNINGEKYFFKMNDFDEEEKIYYHQDIIEVFSSHFFKAVGYGNYVEYFFAHYGPRIGCASKSFLKEKDMREITFERILELEYANKTDNLVYDFDANLYSKRTYDDFYNAQAESTYKIMMEINTSILKIMLLSLLSSSAKTTNSNITKVNLESTIEK